MTFRVGQKVVCVDAFPRFLYKWDRGEELRQNAVYTIHSSFVCPIGLPCVRLCEVKRTAKTFREWGHDGYAAHRFRPIVERKTDISFAHEILRTASQKERA